MADKQWEAQLTRFLRRAGDDLRKTGEDLRIEAHKLFEQVKDPDNQQKVKENLQDFGVWAKKTAGEAAVKLEGVVQKMEETFRATADRASATSAKPVEKPAPVRPEPTSRAGSSRKSVTKPASKPPTKKAAAKGASGKTLGRKKG